MDEITTQAVQMYNCLGYFVSKCKVPKKEQAVKDECLAFIDALLATITNTESNKGDECQKEFQPARNLGAKGPKQAQVSKLKPTQKAKAKETAKKKPLPKKKKGF